MHMVKPLNQYSLLLFFSIIIASALISFGLCIAAEFKKSKKNDLRLDGKLCYLPRSAAVELGIAALICLSMAQVLGSLFICWKFLSKEGTGCKVRKRAVSCSLLFFSWISFGIAVILIGAATTMSKSQPLGEGWLDGECYLVKDGVYVASAMLALLALGSTLGLGIITIAPRKAEENRKVHAQEDK